MGDKNKQNKPKKTLKEKRMEKHQKYEHTSDAVVKQTVLKSIDKSRFLQILIYIGIYMGWLFLLCGRCGGMWVRGVFFLGATNFNTTKTRH